MVMTMTDLNLNQQPAPVPTGRVATLRWADARWADNAAGAAAGFGGSRHAADGCPAAAGHGAHALAPLTATRGGPPRDLRGA